MRLFLARLLASLAAATCAIATAAEPIVDAKSCSPDGVAVGGYDLVSYHHPDGPHAAG